MKEWKNPQLKILGVNETKNSTYEMGPVNDDSSDDCSVSNPIS